VANAELFVTNKTAKGQLVNLNSLKEEQQLDMATFISRRLFGNKEPHKAPEWNLVFTANGRTREYVEDVMHGVGWVYCASPFAIVHNVSSLDVATVTHRNNIYKRVIEGLRGLVKQYKNMPAVKRADYMASPAADEGSYKKSQLARLSAPALETVAARKSKAKGGSRKGRRNRKARTRRR
jgi:hypothetical protein